MNKIQQARLRKTAAHIEAEPATYIQSVWAGFRIADSYMTHLSSAYYTAEAAQQMCGTVACIAGHALLGTTLYKAEALAVDDDGFEAVIVDRNGYKVENYAARAAELLGLSQSESEHLFNGDWKPTGFNYLMDQAEVARLVAADLRAIADGARPMERGSL